MALYPLTSPPGPWQRREDGVGPSGRLPEISGSSGLVKAGETPSEDRGFASKDPCFLFQCSESRARTH